MKAQRLYKFIVVLLLLAWCRGVMAQSKHFSVVPAPIVFLTAKYLEPAGDAVPGATPLNRNLFTPALALVSVPAVIEPDYYTRHFGYFCKKELQFEKATTIPLRFRLGSLDYVNRMEGK